jgi:hypothetical protein
MPVEFGSSLELALEGPQALRACVYQSLEMCVAAERERFRAPGVWPASFHPGFGAPGAGLGGYKGTDELIERVRYPHWRPIRGYSSVG